MKNRIFQIPPNYFKIGNSEKLDREEKPTIIKASNKILVGNYGAANSKDAKIVCDLCGIQSPFYRCAAHSSDGTLKRFARSKAICIAEVVKFMRVYIQWQSNIQVLSSEMELVNMTPKHLLSWSGT